MIFLSEASSPNLGKKLAPDSIGQRVFVPGLAYFYGGGSDGFATELMAQFELGLGGFFSAVGVKTYFDAARSRLMWR